MKRYEVVKVMAQEGERAMETFRIRDTAGADPQDNMLPLVYLGEEQAQIDARRLNWALDDLNYRKE